MSPLPPQSEPATRRTGALIRAPVGIDSTSMPAWTPLAIGLVALALTIVLGLALRSSERRTIQQRFRAQAENLADYVRAHVEERVGALGRMARKEPPSPADFNAEAEVMLRDFPSLDAIAWIDLPGQGHPPDVPFATHLVNPSTAAQRVGMALRMLSPEQRALLQHGDVVLTRSFRMEEGHTAFLVCQPIGQGDARAGCIISPVDVKALLEKILEKTAQPPGYALAVFEDGTRIYGGAPERASQRWVQDVPLSIQPLQWRLQLWPNADLLGSSFTHLPSTTALLGIALSLLLGIAVHQLRRARLHAQGLEHATVALRHEIGERVAAERELKLLNETLEQRVAERGAALGQQAEELARSNAELEQFASVVSHDLKEPLRVISIYAGILQQDLGPEVLPASTSHIASILKAVQHLDRLIRDLLDLARIGSSSAEAPVDLGIALDDAMSNLEVAIAESAAEITHDVLPCVRGERTLLTQLFQNLLGNALKFRGPEPPHIHVGARRDAGEWCLYVQDNGIGIDPKHKERIFVVFQRLHPRDKYDGTGIGLAICKKIVQRQGGRIWVESEPGRGATFFFTIPSEREVPLSDPSAALPARAPAARSSPAPRH